MIRLFKIIRHLTRVKRGENKLHRAIGHLTISSLGKIVFNAMNHNIATEVEALDMMLSLTRELAHEFEWLTDYYLWRKDVPNG